MCRSGNRSLVMGFEVLEQKKRRWLQSILCSQVMRKLFPILGEISCMFFLPEGRQVTAGCIAAVYSYRCFPKSADAGKRVASGPHGPTLCQ